MKEKRTEKTGFCCCQGKMKEGGMFPRPKATSRAANLSKGGTAGGRPRKAG